jgi:hypothetical protein
VRASAHSILGEIYYTYFILDPRTPSFEKNGFSLPHTPIYIGKGKGRRFKDPKSRNNLINNTIAKIKRLGLEPKYLKFYHDLEQEAFNCEEAFVSTFGLKILDQGPLLNLVPGGLGGLGNSNKGKPQPTRGTKMYNNGTKQGRFFPNQVPDNWILGRLDKPWNTGLTKETHPQLGNGGSKKGHKKRPRGNK